MTVIKRTDLTMLDLSVEVEYEYEPAEPDINQGEQFHIISVFVSECDGNEVNVIELLKESVVDALELALRCRG